MNVLPISLTFCGFHPESNAGKTTKFKQFAQKIDKKAYTLLRNPEHLDACDYTFSNVCKSIDDEWKKFIETNLEKSKSTEYSKYAKEYQDFIRKFKETLKNKYTYAVQFKKLSSSSGIFSKEFSDLW